MNCELATNLISARIDAQISADEQRTLEAHLSDCAGCRATLEALGNQDAELRRAFAPRQEAAQRVAARAMFRVRGEAAVERARPALPRRFGFLIPVLSAAAGFALALLILQPWKKPVNVVDNGTTGGPEAVARLALATGAVEVLPPGGEWQPLATGASIPPNTRVRTADKVRCEFVLADGSELRLNANSEVKFNSNRAADLLGGQIFSSLSPGNVPFTVGAAQATITGAGVQFDLAVPQQDRAVVTVVSGSTRIVGRDKAAAQTVGSGQRMTIVAGDAGRKEQVYDLMVATNWVNELLMMKGRDTAELRSRIDGLFAQIGHEKMATMYEAEIRALGDHCFIPLTRYVQSEASKRADQQHKRITAARILSDVATPWCIPELIGLLKDHDGEVRYFAARALQRLTQTGQGYSPDDWRRMEPQRSGDAVERWQEWWQRNKHGYPQAPVQTIAR
jgi:ferric-dicitrate binding protein FerR (iron transport regulator)